MYYYYSLIQSHYYILKNYLFEIMLKEAEIALLKSLTLIHFQHFQIRKMTRWTKRIFKETMSKCWRMPYKIVLFTRHSTFFDVFWRSRYSTFFIESRHMHVTLMHLVLQLNAINNLQSLLLCVLSSRTAETLLVPNYFMAEIVGTHP